MEKEVLKNNYVIIDFDSTFMAVEALEELAEIVLKESAEKDRIIDEIKTITSLGVDGKITFNESLTRRLNLLRVHRSHLDKLVRRLKRKVSVSFNRNKEFFKKYKGHIYIISNGFKEFIDPIVEKFGIDSEHVLANTFLFDEEGWVTGFDQENPLAHSKGKSRRLKDLNLPGVISVIGDAYTDFEMVEAGIAHKFYMFTENVFRESILPKADHVTPSFDEFLYVNKMPRALSYPKSRIKVLVLPGLHPAAADALVNEGYQVDALKKQPDEKELRQQLKDVTILCINAQTPVTAETLRHANRLMAIGLFDTGAGQVDLEACAAAGVIVFNAPYTNTRSQVELAIGQIIMLMRGVPAHSRRMREGIWEHDAKHSFEIRGKKLGIIGYGHAGRQISVLAEALGMDVYFYDLLEKPALGNATKCNTLRELLRKVDVVSLHVDQRPENEGFFNGSVFRSMRQNAILINISHGEAVDLKALAANLRSGKLLGAALDAFPEKKRKKNDELLEELRTFDNVLLTPNIAGNTLEARKETAAFVPERIIDYVNTGSTAESLNFPRLQLPTLKNAHRLIHIHENRPGLLARIDSVLARHDINILGQYLKTNDQIGYVIIDIDKKYGKQVLKDLKQIEYTIKFRVLY